MTVRLVTTIQNYIGLSTDSKPTSVKPGSTFWEYDTNIKFTTYDGTNWRTEKVGSFIATTTEDLNQVANTYDLFTATGAAVVVERFTFTLPNVDCSDDAALTSISIVTDTTTVITLLTVAAGDVANLTANASFTYATPFTLPATKKIQLVIAGGAADAATVCTATVQYQSVAPAGYMA